jgi:hypothetical protein
MATIELKIDTSKVNAFLAGLPEQVLQQATARSLNRTILTVRQGVRTDIASRLKIKGVDLTKGLEVVQRAKPSEAIDEQQVRMVVSSKPQSLGSFNPKQTGIGVTVNVKGQTKVIRHAFLLRGVSGKGGGGDTSGVFIRKNLFKPGTRMKRVGPQRSALPIQKLYTTRISDVFTDQKGRYDQAAQAQLTKEMNSNFQFYYNKYLNS